MTTNLNEARDAALAAERELAGLVPKALAVAVAAASQERQRNFDPMIPPTSKTALAREARQSGLDQITELQVVAQRAQAAIDGFVAQASGSWATGGGVEAELARQAAWQRTRPIIGNDGNAIAANIEAIARAALQSGDQATLEALRREAPAHATAAGAPLPDEVVRNLDLAAGSPAAIHARQLEERARAGASRVNIALGLIREELTTNGDLPAVVPGFGPTEEYHAAARSLTPELVRP